MPEASLSHVSQTLHAPYVALGDSLTQGMQSAGVAWLSQRASYPQQIADFLGIAPFRQPILKGGQPLAALTATNSHAGAPSQSDDAWLGNPPNIELLLRRAERLYSANTGKPGAPPPGAWCEFVNELETIKNVLCEAVGDYVRAVEDADPQALLVYPEPATGLYQNLGVWGFNTLDVSTKNYAMLQGALKLSGGKRLARLGRKAIEGVGDLLGRLRAHPSLLESLSLSLLSLAEHDFGQRIAAEKIGYVLGRGSLTALEAARVQQPRLVTLWIGSNDALETTFTDRLWQDGNPLYTDPAVFAEQIAHLVESILAFDSQPSVFIATLPSPTAAPNLARSRVGHWKSILPTAAYLLDGEILKLEQVIGQYNQAIRELAARCSGRVWVVDIHALQERLLRGSREDAQLVQRVTQHAVRAGHLTPAAARAAERAARAGHLPTIEHARSIEQRLINRSLTAVESLPPEESGATLAHPDLTALPDAPNLDAFTVTLASGATYRLTGEFLAAEDDVISQGGAVGLDAVHLTNTAYGFVAREFIKVIYAANKESHGAVMRGVTAKRPSLDAFDQRLLQVAREDTLLNAPPRLIPAALDAQGALADLLGEYHYTDPLLTR